jgi:tetratricopeptide (TPR) repeat protein
MERSPNEPLTAAVSRDLCERLGVKAVLLGSIAPLSSAYVITLEAQACHTGDTLAREQAQAASKTDVLATVGAAAARIREQLGESIGSIQKFNVPAPNATTPSLEALKAYSMGLQTRITTGDVQAIPLFEHALDIDPSFALAAARLGAIYTNLRDLDRARIYMKQAFARSESLSEPERLFIRAHYHYIVTGRLDDVVGTYRLWISTYPQDWIPHNNLSDVYSRLNQFDDAVLEGQTAVKLAPRSLVAYQQLARTMLLLGRTPEAKALLDAAASNGLDSSALHALAFDLAFIARDTGAMQEHLRAASSRADGYLVLIEAARAAFATGDIDTSRTLYSQAVTAARRAGINDFVGGLIAEQALDDALVGDIDHAHAQLQSALAVSRGPETTWTASLAASFSGRTAQASELAKAFQAQQPAAPDIVNAQVPMLQAAVAVASNDGASAISMLNSAAPFEAVAGPWLPYLRGLAHTAVRDHTQAARQFGNVIAHPGNQPTNVVHSLARLQLARAARDAGDVAGARQAYADFATAWRDANSRQPLLVLSAREAAALPAAASAPPR